MFERWKEKHAEGNYEKALAAWQEQEKAHAELVTFAEGFEGLDTDEIVLKAGERLFYKVSGVALIEDRVRGGHYEGGSRGVSVPIGSIGGRTVRYHVGSQRGHYVQGTPTPTAIDEGTVYITNQRVVFAGSKQTRECTFAKLISAQHDDAEGATTLAVSNRQKPTTIFYGPDISGAFDFRLELALAHFKGTVNEVVDAAKRDLQTIEGQRPQAPAALAG